MAKAKGTKAAGYVRVSTDDQAKHGLSLDAQEEAIHEYCQRQRLELVRIYREEGKSASKELNKRTAFLKMVADAASGGFAAVIVYHVDRFSRSPRDYYAVTDLLEAKGVNLIALNDPEFDSNDPGHEMKRGMDITVARYQARLSRAKMLDVLQRKLESGKRNIGQRIPYGLKWAEDEASLLHDPKTYPVWRLMMDLRSQGWGYGRIANSLNGHVQVPSILLQRYGVSLPVPNRYGKAVWREGAIAGMFRDSSRYLGRQEFSYPNRRGERQQHVVEFEPLMTKAQFEKFAALSKKKLTWIPRNVGKGSLLSSLCKCGICGATLHVSGSRRRLYYGCANRLRPAYGSARCALPLIPQDSLELRVLRTIAGFLLDEALFKRALALASPSKTEKTRQEIERQEKKLATEDREAKERLERLVKAAAEGALELEDIRAERERIQETQRQNAQKKAELAIQKEGLGRKIERLKIIHDTRTRLGRMINRSTDLRRLPMEQLRDLLRSFLPVGSETGIKVSPSKALPADPKAKIGGYFIEIIGLLPVERAELKKAVLGGAVAVP